MRRTAMTAACLTLLWSGVWHARAQDDEVRELRARLAEQESMLRRALDNSQVMRAQMAEQNARIHDLNAKMSVASVRGDGAASGVTSLRKNAKVTIGGMLNTRYTYWSGEFRTKLQLEGEAGKPGAGYSKRTDGRRVKAEDYGHGDYRIKDAKIDFKIDVNDHFDAFIRLDPQDTPRSNVSGVAQNYWVRWKNICNSGFGLLVGRDVLKFGDLQPIGGIGTWNKTVYDSGTFEMTIPSQYRNHDGTKGNGMFAYDSPMPAHTTYDFTRTTQINPYWESADGAWRVDVSLLQSIDRINGLVDRHAWDYDRGDYTTRKYRSINQGLGSATARVVWKPMEGLKFTASAMNLYAQGRGGWVWGPEGRREGADYGVETAKNNSSINLAFQYRPTFLNRLNVWAQWTHGWNESWVDDMDSDSLTFGVTYDLTAALTLFVQGDYLYVKNSQSSYWNKADGWAVYSGFLYKFPYGVNIEGGWRHERIDYKDRTGDTHSKYKGDFIYAQLGFNF